MKIVDLTHIIHEKMPVFPGTERPIIHKANTVEKDGFKEAKLTMYSHTGTHIDAPAHMLIDGLTLDKFHADQFIGKAIILDFSDLDKKSIELIDIQRHRELIDQVDFVILKTGWEKFWGQDRYYEDFPALSPDAATWLSEHKLKGVGIDAISIDAMESKGFSVHKILMSKDIIIIENLTNLDMISSEQFILSILPLKTVDADGSPVRAIAII